MDREPVSSRLKGEANMIADISKQEMESFLKKEYPSRSKQSIQDHAREYLSTIDDRLSPATEALIKKGQRIDFKHGEFSLYLIQALRHNCSYWKAILLMDAYLKDPLNGKALILRR